MQGGNRGESDTDANRLRSVLPPSITFCVPVLNSWIRSDARKAASSPTSSGSARRRIGIAFAISVSTDSGSSWVRLAGNAFRHWCAHVSRANGVNANTRLARTPPRQRFCQAQQSPLSLRRTPFLARNRPTISPVTEDIITMRPSLRAIISGSTAFVTFHTPLILMSIWKSRSSSLISRKLPRRQTPALFTRISMRPFFFPSRV